MPSTTVVNKKNVRENISRPVRPVNMAELLEQLGNIPAERVRLEPVPGHATKKDLLSLLGRDKTLCELVDGTLVEKVAGHLESALGVWLSHWLLT